MSTKPEYYFPLWKKILMSGGLILLMLLFIGIILWYKIGFLLGVKSYDHKYVPILFCGLVPTFHHWDAMWTKNPLSHY